MKTKTNQPATSSHAPYLLLISLLRSCISRKQDVRITFADMGALKPTLPLGQVPVLEVDGAAITQSIPISRYAAKLAGLYPADPLAALYADEVVATIDEVWGKIGKAKSPERLAFGAETAPKYIALLEKRLGAGPFFGGAAPSFADLWFYAFASITSSGFFDDVPKDYIAAAGGAKLTASIEAFKASELYAKYGTPE